MTPKRRDCRLMMCTAVLHGGVCHRTSTPHKSGTKMKEKKKKQRPVLHSLRHEQATISRQLSDMGLNAIGTACSPDSPSLRPISEDVGYIARIPRPWRSGLSSMLPSSSCNITWITSRSSHILAATCQATATQSRTYAPGSEKLHPFSNCFVLYNHQLPSTWM